MRLQKPNFAMVAAGTILAVGTLLVPAPALADENPDAPAAMIHDPVPSRPAKSKRVRVVYIRCWTPNNTSLRLQVSSDRARCEIYGLSPTPHHSHD